MSSEIWYRAELSSEQVSAGHVEIVRRLFAAALNETPDSLGVCLFATSDNAHAAQLPEETTEDAGAEANALFFSPKSISAVPHLIAQYRARPSAPPDRGRVVLLVGVEEDWDLLPRSSH
jgi:hypothetical protein